MLRLQLYSAVPPLAVRVAEKLVPTVPPAINLVVMLSAAGAEAILMLNALFAV